MDWTSPTSFRLANPGLELPVDAAAAQMPFIIFKKKKHESHPSLDHLVLLVFEAVMEVVCVSLPGYIIARLGHFDADKQKFLANLNVMLFTPCLIFTKLASQLNADKLLELGIIPVIFIMQTLVSYFVSTVVTKAFRLNKRGSNFVTAMGVFGNSNSLPISLVLSLSQTLQGLHWDKIRGDNDDEVAARGILYLMIFQQLGQVVRWSWGYHVLLAPKDKYEEYNDEAAEEGRYAYADAADAQDSQETQGLIADMYDRDEFGERGSTPTTDDSEAAYEPAGRTPVAGHSRASPAESESDEDHDDDDDDDDYTPKKKRSTGGSSGGKHHHHHHHHHRNGSHPPDFRGLPEDDVDGMLSFPRIRNTDEPELPTGLRGIPSRIRFHAAKAGRAVAGRVSRAGRRLFDTLPPPAQLTLRAIGRAWTRVYNFLWEFMNPPLWAMVCAIVVASVPDLQRLFFQEGSFIKNSVTSAVSQSAGVAVPLILVVLGANLARNTQQHDTHDAEEDRIGTRLLVASLVCRMLLPTLIMAPILAVFAKYVPISILDDPIFVIVCFLLTGAPSALQLAQICQINGVYEKTMSKILFQSYVIWILPSTLVLVMCALEVVEWAK